MPTSVWIVGSSIVRNGFIVAKTRPGGINLGLQARLGVSIWWQGRGGLDTRMIRRHIRLMMQYEDPEFIMIHVGANDIGTVKLGYLQLLLKRFFHLAVSGVAIHKNDFFTNVAKVKMASF